MTLPALFLFLSPPVDVRPLPDAPIAKVQTVHSPVNTPFMDKPARIALGVNAGLFAVDAGQMCNNLAHHGHEDYLPSQKCGPDVAIMGAEAGALWLGALVAHKHHWHKLERICEWVMPAVNTRALIYSHAHGAF